VIEYYERLQSEYEGRTGEGEMVSPSEFDEWYAEMVDEFGESGEFLYPDLHLFYHARS
jgi:hypothetical protein